MRDIVPFHATALSIGSADRPGDGGKRRALALGVVASERIGWRRSMNLASGVALGVDWSGARGAIETAFRDGVIRTTGTAITKVLPAVSRFSAGCSHSEKKQRVLNELSAFFERFFALSAGHTN